MLSIRVIMMMIHSYFNIYKTFWKGYQKINLRLLTGQKLYSLKEVNVEEVLILKFFFRNNLGKSSQKISEIKFEI